MFIQIIYTGTGCKCVSSLWLIVHLGACAFGEGGRPAGAVGTTDCCLQTGAIHPHTGSICMELPNDVRKHGHRGKDMMIIKKPYILSCN